jgi:hypothetical protein
VTFRESCVFTRRKPVDAAVPQELLILVFEISVAEMADGEVEKPSCIALRRP